jgi:aspartate/methionine/tyrosine aminotransferase
MLALLEPGDEVIYPNPGFPIYESMINFLGAKPVPMPLVEERGFVFDLDRLKDSLNDRTKMLVLNSPQNPTGGQISKEDMKVIADLVRDRDLIVLADEIYWEISYDQPPVSITTFPGMLDKTIILDGFSKSFAMTGWRLGYTVAPSYIVPALDMLTVNSYTCTAEFTQYAAIEAMRDKEGATPRMVSEFAKRREQFVRDLNRVPGFRCQPPEGAFYAWVNILDTGMSAEDICEIMLEDAGVAGIPGAAFGPEGKDFVRFSFASSTATLKAAVERIMKVSSAWQGTPAGR